MKNSIDSMIENAVRIGVSTSSKLKFGDVTKSSNYFHKVIYKEIVEKFRHRISNKKSAYIAEYLTEIALLGYTLHKVGIYEELSFGEFVNMIKKNKPLKIIAFELEIQGKSHLRINTEDELSLNVA